MIYNRKRPGRKDGEKDEVRRSVGDRVGSKRKDAKLGRQRTVSVGKGQMVEKQKSSHQNHSLGRHAYAIQRNNFNLLWFSFYCFRTSVAWTDKLFI